MYTLEGPRHGGRILRHGDEMYMIRHQAIAEQSQSIVSRELGEELEVEPAILVTIKDLLSVVSALRDMMRDTGHNESWWSWHNKEVRSRRGLSHRIRWSEVFDSRCADVTRCARGL